MMEPYFQRRAARRRDGGSLLIAPTMVEDGHEFGRNYTRVCLKNRNPDDNDGRVWRAKSQITFLFY